MQELVGRLMQRSSGMASIIGECLGTNKAVSFHLKNLLEEKAMSNEVKSHLIAMIDILDNRVKEVNTKWDVLQQQVANNLNTEPSNN